MTTSGSATKTVEVELGARSYDILIGRGILAEAGERISRLHPGSRAIIITDENVDDAHGDQLRQSLKASGIDCVTHSVTPGEPSKSFATLESVVDVILASGMERQDVLIAFGGGVVGDLAGFAAGIARRGMPFVQIPTSLLAQVDSSVGGKTGINTARGKNLVGLFNQPTLVLADTGLLATLPLRERRAGYAEVAKYGLIDQPDFFQWLESAHDDVFALGDAMVHAVATSCRAKAAVVKADERESGQRALLNLGHTFGHALEACVKYDGSKLVHGEAVAIGMVLAHEFSARQGLCPEGDVQRVIAHLKNVGLPVQLQQIADVDFSIDGLMDAIAQDKKVSRGSLTFILTRGIGKAFVAQDVDAAAVRQFLLQKLAA